MTCDAPDCPKPPYQRGLCAMHVYRLRTHGSLDLPEPPPPTVIVPPPAWPTIEEAAAVARAARLALLSKAVD